MTQEEAAARDLVLLGLFPGTGREGRGGGAHGPLALGFSLGSTGSTRERKRLMVLLP